MPSRSFWCTAIAGYAAVLALSEPAGAWPTGPDCADTAGAAALRDTLAETLLQGASGYTISTLDKCRAKIPLGQQTAFDRCFERVRAYADLLGVPGLGLPGMTNDAYENAHGTGPLAIPVKLADRELFDRLKAANLSDRSSVEAVVKRVKELYGKALVVPYVSATTPSIDNTTGMYNRDRRGRFIVWIPDEVDPSLSRYVQFTVNTDPTTPTSVDRVQASIVTFKRGTGAYVFDWKRDDTTATFVYDRGFGNDQHCYTCHASGVLAIHPFQTGDDDVGRAAQGLGLDYAAWLDPLNATYRGELRKLNDQILTEYGTSRASVVGAPTRRTVLQGLEFPNGMLEPRPSDGVCTTDEYAAVAALRPRGPTSVEGWAPGWGKWFRDQVGWTPEILYRETPGPILNTKCSTCHIDRGSSVFDVASYTDLIGKYVEGGWMPPDLPSYDSRGEIVRNQVPLVDRQRAAECYRKRLEAVVSAWLRDTVCTGL
jgi:hypothetical protein